MKSVEVVMILGNRAALLSGYTIPALLKSCVNAVTDYLIDVRICLNGFNHAKYDKNICNVHKYNELMKKSGGVKSKIIKEKLPKIFPFYRMGVSLAVILVIFGGQCLKEAIYGMIFSENNC